MKVVFSSKKINEYSNGPFHVMNDGEPIELPSAFAADVLAATQFIDGEEVNVFVPAKDQSDDSKDHPDETPNAADEFPENFPSVSVFRKLGLTYADVRLLDRDQLIGLKGIGEKAADAVLDFTDESITEEID
jgi:hypothetical protein